LNDFNLPFRKLAEGKPARMNEFSRSGGDLRGIYPEPVEGIPNAESNIDEKFSAFIGLQTENNNRTQVISVLPINKVYFI